MKKFFAYLGLAAAGTANLHAAYTPDMGDTSKMWNISATLRGFYDDNYTTTPDKHGSLGFEASPTLSLNVPLQQTEIGMRYTYGLYYYQNREDLGQKPVDQTHQFDLWVDHAFTERWEARVQDTVVVAQEPQLLQPNSVSVYQRLEGNNLVNRGRISLHTDWTREFSTELGYQNTLYDYQQSGGNTVFPYNNPSYAGSLNRIEHLANLDLQWHFSRITTGYVGYQYGQVNFTGDEPVALNSATGLPYYSDSRDNRSHYGYVGMQHAFTENLSLNVKGGVQYTEYYNDPSATSSLGPYADASLIYTYAPGSYAQIGFSQSRNATDTIRVDSNGHITQDQESSVVYGAINHALTPKLTASMVGHIQYSTYHNGYYNDQSATFYNLGLNLSYAINRFWSSEVGYNFDYYTSDIPGQRYSRNRVYVGVSASY